MKIAIIGAGPVGCFCGYLLAKKGFDTEIYEEHKKIGKPVQCTGILTSEINKIIKIKNDFVVNKIKNVNVVAPNNNSVKVNVNDLIVDREKFDKHFYNLAKENGCKFFLNHKLVGYDNNLIFETKNKIKKINANIIIGADGSLSNTAKIFGLNKNRKYYFGLQATVKGNFEKENYKVYLGNVAPKFFAWVVPENEKTARIGLATTMNLNAHFKNLLKKLNINEKNIVDLQSGLIPIYNPKAKISRKNVFLVGDAANQVKATTGGGIIPGLKAAKVLADCILKKKNYEKELKKVNKNLKLHLTLRKMMNKFSDNDYNKLISLLNNGKIRKIFNSYERENPKKLLIKLGMNELRLLKFGTKLF